MTIQKFLSLLSQELNNFTIYDDEKHYPFGCSLERYWEKDGSRKSGVSFPNYPVSSRGLKEINGNVTGTTYDVKRDNRIYSQFLDVSSKDVEARDSLYFVPLVIIGSLCTYLISIPNTEQMREIIKLSGYSIYEINRRSAGIPPAHLSCFNSPKMQPIGLLLSFLLRDALDETAGIDRYGNKKSGGKKNISEAAYIKLSKVIDYMQIEGIIDTPSLPISIFSHKKIDRYSLGEVKAEKVGDDYIDKIIVSQEEYDKDTVSDERAEELKAQAQELYETFIIKRAINHCKKVITQIEIENLHNKIDNEDKRFGSTLSSLIQRDLRAIKRKRNSNFPKNINSNILKGINFNEPLFSPANYQQDEVSYLEYLCETFDGTGLPEFNRVLKDFILSRQNISEELEETLSFVNRSVAATKASNEYLEKLEGRVQKIITETQMEDMKPLILDDLVDLSESFLIAIMCGDELAKIDCYKYLVVSLLVCSTMPFSGAPALNLEDEKFWDDDCCPGDNGELETVIVDIDDKLKRTIPNTPLVEEFSIATMIARYANYRFNAPFAIRKSLIKAFQELGVSRQKARDYAIIISALRAQRMEDDYIPDGYEIFPERLTDGQEQESEKDIEIEALKSERNDALKKAKASEREGQTARHELAVLQRKYDALQLELERSNALIEEYERRDESAESDLQSIDEQESDIVFPYHTDLKIILFGGFDSFHSEIVRLLPDLKIVPPSSHFDTTQFKNADIVFIQINKTSHSRYWAVLDTARAANVPYFHLSMASPKRCACEVVRRIKEIESRN